MVDPVLVSHLHLLAAGLDADDDLGVQDALTALIKDLRSAVPSYRGLQLRIVDHDWTVTLTDFAGDLAHPPITSLRVDLVLLVQGTDPASAIVFYADTPGTFVDLAADLNHALVAVQNGDGEQRHPVALDADLPSSSPRSGLVGVDGLATINRAIGFLIGQGQPPDDASNTIRRGAASAGVDTPTFAARLLRR